MNGLLVLRKNSAQWVGIVVGLYFVSLGFEFVFSTTSTVRAANNLMFAMLFVALMTGAFVLWPTSSFWARALCFLGLLATAITALLQIVLSKPIDPRILGFVLFYLAVFVVLTLKKSAWVLWGGALGAVAALPVCLLFIVQTSDFRWQSGLRYPVLVGVLALFLVFPLALRNLNWLHSMGIFLLASPIVFFAVASINRLAIAGISLLLASCGVYCILGVYRNRGNAKQAIGPFLCFSVFVVTLVAQWRLFVSKTFNIGRIDGSGVDLSAVPLVPPNFSVDDRGRADLRLMAVEQIGSSDVSSVLFGVVSDPRVTEAGSLESQLLIDANRSAVGMDSLHNEYLAVILNLGAAPATFLFVTFFSFVLLAFILILRSDTDKLYALFFASYSCYFFLLAFHESVFLVPAYVLLFAIFVGSGNFWCPGKPLRVRRTNSPLTEV